MPCAAVASADRATGQKNWLWLEGTDAAQLDKISGILFIFSNVRAHHGFALLI
jgi:hypothetical protein